MARTTHPKPPPDIGELLALIDAGRLYEVQEWIAAGKRVNFADNERLWFCPLYRAAETGFHSMVELLLKERHWSQWDLNSTLSMVVEERRTDFMELLLDAGAEAAAIDFKDICKLADFPLMERLMRLGADPENSNGLARGLVNVGARPLFAFCKTYCGDMPALRRQASLALAEAIRQKKLRIASLLRWSGADPWMRVPVFISDSWEFDELGGRTPADEAARSKDVAFLKCLHIKPTLPQARTLLEDVVEHPSPQVLELLLRISPRSILTDAEFASGLVERFMSQLNVYSFGYHPDTEIDRDDVDRIACLEMLMKAGAHWNLQFERVAMFRRNLAKCRPTYVARVMRLFTAYEGTVSRFVLRGLLATPLLLDIVAREDAELHTKLREIRNARY